MTTANTSKNSVKQITDPFIFLFSLTLFISAALTFTIQPMIGKMLLPLVGGAPAGWLITMVYFQIALLAGYAIAHLLSRVAVLYHMLVVGILLLCGLISFPLYLNSMLIESSGLPEALGVLLALTAGLTLPCVALFTLSPTLQRLFEAGSARTTRDPYFLFAASNAGSLGGLLAYPLLIERVSGLSCQSIAWEAAYIILIAFCGLCLLLAYGQIDKVRKARAKATPINWRMRGRWALLAFIPSSLMLGVTAHITTDTGSVPFFWVLPLALYLLTFILAFARRQWLTLPNIDFLQTASVAVLIAFFIKTPAIVSAPEDMLFPVLAFFITALFCHFTLAAERPSAQKLTEFYLWVAVGGALGGMFNTLVAPFIFPLPIEFIFVALLSCLIHPPRAGLKSKKIRRLLIAAAIAAVPASALCSASMFNDERIIRILIGTILMMSFLILSLSPRLLAAMALVLSLFSISIHNVYLLDAYRDFFGVLRVYDNHDHKDPPIVIRGLYHGSTLHGQEQIAPEKSVEPNGYYDTEGPLGDVMTLRHPDDVGIVGLGAGTTLCYQAEGRHFTVYELDPAVPVIAKKWFDFIHDCGTPEFRIGDGRRLLARERGPKHDVLILDAFTSDAIPVHLLTREAFRIYFSRLKPDGLLAVHISNRFYDLRYPISDVANSLRLHALVKLVIPPAARTLAVASRWVVIARDKTQLKEFVKQGWQELPPSEDRAWTDDFSDTLSALKILHTMNETPNAQTH